MINETSEYGEHNGSRNLTKIWSGYMYLKNLRKNRPTISTFIICWNFVLEVLWHQRTKFTLTSLLNGWRHSSQFIPINQSINQSINDFRVRSKLTDRPTKFSLTNSRTITDKLKLKRRWAVPCTRRQSTNHLLPLKPQQRFNVLWFSYIDHATWSMFMIIDHDHWSWSARTVVQISSVATIWVDCL